MSLSLDVAALLADPTLQAAVESAFADACNLVAEDGRRFSLVNHRVGDGPGNAVLKHGQMLCLLSSGDTVSGNGHRLRLGRSVHVDLRSARPWDPHPDYRRLALRPGTVVDHVSRLRLALPLEAPPVSLASRHPCSTQGAFGSHPALSLVHARAGQICSSLLAAHRHRNLAGIQAHARQLAGLGPGLTPAGDDWLAGWLIGLRCQAALEPDREALPVAAVGRTVVAVAAGRTSGFSLAHLAAAADGAAPLAWHHLLDALAKPEEQPVFAAVGTIVQRGETSGFDMLAGFLAAFPCSFR
jgi:hypothetical protein